MSYTYTYTRAPKGITQIHNILECTFINGACVTHQRRIDKPRPGCPYADSIMRQAQTHGTTSHKP